MGGKKGQKGYKVRLHTFPRKDDRPRHLNHIVPFLNFMMDLPNGWSQEQLAWLKPNFANILSQNPLLPPLDFVSDRNLLDALRQQLSLVDAKVVIPDDLKKEEVKMPNGMMANLFRRRNDTDQLKEGSAQGAVLIVHGGGYVAGTIGIMTQTAIALAQDTNLVSIVLPYRLAPEAPFPAGYVSLLLFWVI